MEAEELAVSVAADVLSDDRVVSRGDVLQPAKSDDEFAQEFWNYVGFPTRASRLWEQGSSEDGGDTHGKFSSDVCRTPEASSPEMSSTEGMRTRSWSASAGQPQSPPKG